MARFFLDICLSDIPKERIKTAANGKKYLKAFINPRKEADGDGFDHYIAVSIPQAERNPDDRPVFIGRAQEKREQQHTGGTPFKERQNSAAGGGQEGNDDLPF